MPEKSDAADIKMILSLTLVHFIGDLYYSFVNPLLPLFIEKYALSLTQVGLIAGVGRFFAFIVQPSVGYLADHYRTRLFILGGPLLAIVFLSMVGVAPTYVFLLVFVSLGSIGTSMFHPVIAGMISTYAGRQLGFSMSIFNTGGTVAFGVGPILITQYVNRFGLEALPYVMIFGLTAMIYPFLYVPRPEGERLKESGFVGSLKEALGPVWKSVFLIWTVMVLRSFVGQSFMTFIPVIYASNGYSIVSVGIIVSLFTIAGAVSGLLSGHLSDKFGFKPIFFISFSATPPCLLLLLSARGNWVYPLAFFAGFFALATMPLGVAMAQKLAPKGKSMVSSLMMGVAFGTGGLLAPLTGKLGDLFSIQSVLTWIALIPFIAMIFIFKIKERPDP